MHDVLEDARRVDAFAGDDVLDQEHRAEFGHALGRARRDHAERRQLDRLQREHKLGALKAVARLCDAVEVK